MARALLRPSAMLRMTMWVLLTVGVLAARAPAVVELSEPLVGTCQGVENNFGGRMFPVGRLLAIGSNHGEFCSVLSVYDPRKGEYVRLFLDTQLVGVAGDDLIVIDDAASSSLRRIRRYSGAVRAVYGEPFMDPREVGPAVRVGKFIVLAVRRSAEGGPARLQVFLASGGPVVRSISNPDPDPNEWQFGQSLAVVGRHVLVAGRGNAWLIDPSTGDIVAALESPDAAAGEDSFGATVAGTSSFLAVSAPHSGTWYGAVHIYDVTTLRLRRTLREPGVEGFGWGLAMSGRRLLVTATMEQGDCPVQQPAGAAFAYDVVTGRRLASTFRCFYDDDAWTWGQTAALVGDTGGVNFRHGGTSDAGYVHVFPLR